VNRRWRKLALWLGLPLLLAAVLLVAAWQALHTSQGLRFAFDWVAGQVPGVLTAETIDGSLAGPWRVTGLSYSDGAGLDVGLQELTVTWRPAALLGGQVHITAVEGQALSVRVPPGNGDSQSPAALPQLPVSLHIDDLALTGIEVIAAGAEPLHIESVDLAGSISGAGVRLERLKVALAEGELELSGQLDPWRGYAHELKGQARLEWPGQPEISGRFSLDGDGDRVAANLELSTPLAARLEMVVDTPLEQPSWQGRLQATATESSLLGADLPAWPTEVMFDGRGTLETFAGTLAVRLQHPELGQVVVDGPIEGDRSRVVLDQVTLRGGDPEMRLRLASATVELAGDAPRFNALGSWQEVRWPLTGEPEVASPSGRFEVAGTTDAYRLELAGRIEVPEQPGFEVALEGDGDLNALQLAAWSVALDQNGGRLVGAGDIGWDPELQVTLQGQVEKLDPGGFAADWPGRLDGPFAVDARMTPDGPRWQATFAGFSGVLRGHEVSARGRIKGVGDAVTLDGVEARVGTLDATLDGRLGRTLDLRWTFASDAIDGLLGLAPGLAGRATAHGTLSGSRETPAMTVEAEADELRLDEHLVERVTLRGRADAGPEGELDLALSATNLQLGGKAVNRLEVTGSGSLAKHRLQADTRIGEERVQIALAGGLDGETWRGELAQGVLTSHEWGRLQLQAPASLVLSAGAAEVADHCWQRHLDEATAPGALCGGGRWRKGGAWDTDLRLVDLPLGLVNLLFLEGVALSGEVAGEATFHGAADGAIEGRGELRIGPGHLDPGGVIEGAAPLAFAGGMAQLVAGDGGTSATVHIDLGGTDRIDGRIALPGLVPGRSPASDLAVDGEVTFVLTQLDLLATLAPTLGFGPGHIDGSLVIAGTVGAPSLEGSAVIAMESIEVPEAGLTLRGIELRARGTGGDRLLLEGKASSGEGALRVDGHLVRDPAGGWMLELTVDGERVTAVDLHELRLLVSPDLELKLRGQDLAVTGTLVVPEALIRPRLGGTTLEGVSVDTVMVGGTGEQAETDRLRVDARLRLALGDQVRFEGFGLRGRIEGAVDIVQRPDAVPLGIGELRLVDGNFNRFGQDLVIESGRLQFANSPLDDPGIDAQAVREIGSIKAGVRLHGSVRRLETTVFSEPPMSQADALSYLVLGAPAGQSGGSDASKVAAASAALGFLADRTGIDAVSVESDGVSDTMSLVLGQYLSPELYVGYAVGLTSPTNTFIARYKLTEQLSVEASSGTGVSGAFSGADVKYEIER